MSDKLKKLYISCPLNGRKPEDIVATRIKLKSIAEAYVGEKLEVIPFKLNATSPETKSERIWLLGESIKKMATADYFIGVGLYGAYDGCSIEYDVAKTYDIPIWIIEAEHCAKDIITVDPDNSYKGHYIPVSGEVKGVIA